MIKIELATQNELDRVKEIAEACAKNMIENNIFQWNDKYLDINWRIDKNKVILSSKDKKANNFKNFISPF